ncbi:MAG: hypothetical protein MJ159_02010 [Treponemataceae bacterium]|nr:hypothetical protein [Treponemataceae bacterium]
MLHKDKALSKSILRKRFIVIAIANICKVFFIFFCNILKCNIEFYKTKSKNLQNINFLMLEKHLGEKRTSTQKRVLFSPKPPLFSSTAKGFRQPLETADNSHYLVWFFAAMVETILFYLGQAGTCTSYTSLVFALGLITYFGLIRRKAISTADSGEILLHKTRNFLQVMLVCASKLAAIRDSE